MYGLIYVLYVYVYLTTLCIVLCKCQSVIATSLNSEINCTDSFISIGVYIGFIYLLVYIRLRGRSVGGGGGGELRGNFGTGVRASISKPTPFIYLAFAKTDPFIYLIIQNLDLFIYCPLIFCTHFLLVVTQVSQSVHVIPRG